MAETNRIQNRENIFSPYVVLQFDHACIHLAVTKARRALFICSFNVMPFVIMLLIPGIFITSDGHVPIQYLVLLAASALAAAIFLLFNRAVLEVRITATEILIHSVVAFRKSVRKIAVGDVEHIFVDIVKGSKSRTSFRLLLKNGKSVQLLMIPGLFMEHEHTRLIENELSQLTGLVVKEKGIFSVSR